MRGAASGVCATIGTSTSALHALEWRNVQRRVKRKVLTSRAADPEPLQNSQTVSPRSWSLGTGKATQHWPMHAALRALAHLVPIAARHLELRTVRQLDLSEGHEVIEACLPSHFSIEEPAHLFTGRGFCQPRKQCVMLPRGRFLQGFEPGDEASATARHVPVSADTAARAASTNSCSMKVPGAMLC